MADRISQIQYEYRQMRLLGVIKDDLKDSFFVKSKKIPIGTLEPAYEYSDMTSMSDSDWYWVDVKMRQHQNLIGAQPGNLKSTLEKVQLPFYFYQGAKMALFEYKDASFSRAKELCAGSKIVHKDVQPTTLPIYSLCPSYLVSKNKPKAYQVGVEHYKKSADAVLSLSTKSVPSSAAWRTLLGSQPTGSDVMHQINQEANNLGEIKAQINTGKYKSFYEGKSTVQFINSQTRDSLKIKIQNFMEDEVFDVGGTKRFILKEGGYEGQTLSIPDVWEMNMLPETPFFQRNPEYGRLYANDGMNQETIYAQAFKAKNGLRAPLLIKNIWEDCATLFNKGDTNYAVDTLIDNINLQRANCEFSNDFLVQDLNEISPRIIRACTDFFIGYILSLTPLKDIVDDRALDKIEHNKNHKEIRGNRIYVPYVHINSENPAGTTFYPADPLCGGWG